MSSDCPVPAMTVLLGPDQRVRHVGARALHVRMQLPVPVAVLQDLEALQELVPHLHADREVLSVPGHLPLADPLVPRANEEVLCVQPLGHGGDLDALVSDLLPRHSAQAHRLVRRALELDLDDRPGLRADRPVEAVGGLAGAGADDLCVLQARPLHGWMEDLGPVPVADNLELGVLARQQQLDAVDVRHERMPLHLLEAPLVPVRGDEEGLPRARGVHGQSQVAAYVEPVEDREVLGVVLLAMDGPAPQQARQGVVVRLHRCGVFAQGPVAHSQVLHQDCRHMSIPVLE
mmetsp:Transcript_60886/g.163005  ORF Transcript_60886/g.163005 Transcript_60886/m.163005 type:complete len:289 (-) Transcript_60886:900-1766(-)